MFALIWILCSLITFLLICYVARLEKEPIGTWDSALLSPAILASIFFPLGICICVIGLIISKNPPPAKDFLLRERKFYWNKDK